MKNLRKKCFLIAGMGTSPAVLTETVQINYYNKWSKVCKISLRRTSMGVERKQ